MSLDCEKAEVTQSAGRAELDNLDRELVTKAYRSVWWRDFTGDFNSVLPILCVTPVLSHWVCPSWGSSVRAQTVPQIHYFTAFNQLNSGCWSQHLLYLHFPIVVADSTVEVFPEVVKHAAINSNRAVGKCHLCSRILQTEVQHTELTKNLSNTFPRKKKNNKGHDGGGKWTYIFKT